GAPRDQPGIFAYAGIPDLAGFVITEIRRLENLPVKRRPEGIDVDVGHNGSEFYSNAGQIPITNSMRNVTSMDVTLKGGSAGASDRTSAESFDAAGRNTTAVSVWFAAVAADDVVVPSERFVLLRRTNYGQTASASGSRAARGFRAPG